METLRPREPQQAPSSFTPDQHRDEPEARDELCLKGKNMSASAKGTAKAPSKGVKAKSGLNKSILDQGGASI